MTSPEGSGTGVPPRVERADGDLPVPSRPGPDIPQGDRGDAFPLELIASTGDGLIALDRNLRHTLWNPRMEELTGVSPDAALGRDILQVFPLSRQKDAAALLERALAGETVTSDDFSWPSPRGGGERWLSAEIGRAHV